MSFAASETLKRQEAEPGHWAQSRTSSSYPGLHALPCPSPPPLTQATQEVKRTSCSSHVASTLILTASATATILCAPSPNSVRDADAMEIQEKSIRNDKHEHVVYIEYS